MVGFSGFSGLQSVFFTKYFSLLFLDKSTLRIEKQLDQFFLFGAGFHRANMGTSKFYFYLDLTHREKTLSSSHINGKVEG